VTRKFGLPKYGIVLLAALDFAMAPAGTIPASAETTAAATTEASRSRLVRDGLAIELSVRPDRGGLTERVDDTDIDSTLREGHYATVTFTIRDQATGAGVPALYPAAWVDLALPEKNKDRHEKACKDRAALYLKGIVGMRPMIDLNSYFVLVMNEDASISVIDPILGVGGITKLYAQVLLKRPGGDWARNKAQTRLFVTMPRANQIAVIDTETFKVIKSVDVGRWPLRVALQGDEKYLWVGNDAKPKEESGVSVIDAERMSPVATIATGRGHHEIAFSGDDSYAFVSNRESGTVSVIDVRSLKKIKEIKTGRLPISIAYSPLSKALYVADGHDGEIVVLDGERHTIRKRIALEPGLGPTRVSPDGRWVFTVNPAKSQVYVIDASTDKVAHRISVAGKPYQVSFTRAFGYIRAIDSERVAMINLSQLGNSAPPPVVSFGAGAAAPSKGGALSIADGVREAAGEAAVLVTSPGDRTVYYYMEGMNAPMGNFRNYGHKPVAVQVTDRSLAERKPGVYATKIRIPAAGEYDVAFLLDSPRILHCFRFKAEENPFLKQHTKPLGVEYLMKDRTFTVGRDLRLRFRLTDPNANRPRTDLKDVSVLYYLAPGKQRTELRARHIADGVYEAVLTPEAAGAYYLYVASASAGVRYGDLPYITLRGVSRDAQANGKTTQ